MRKDQLDSNIFYAGAWTNCTPTSGSPYNGTYSRTSTSASYVDITFVGTRLDWIAMKGTTTGFADVYVDNMTTKVTTIDLSAAAATYVVNVWNTGTLSFGTHTVRIQWSPSNTSAKNVTIHAVDVWGILPPAL